MMINNNNYSVTKAFKDFLNRNPLGVDIEENENGEWISIDDELAIMGSAYEMLDCFNNKYKFLYEREQNYYKDMIRKIINNNQILGSSPYNVLNYLGIKSSCFGIISQDMIPGETIFIPKEAFDWNKCVILYLLANNINVIFDKTIDEMLNSNMHFDKIFVILNIPINIDEILLEKYYSHLNQGGTIIVKTFGEEYKKTSQHIEFTRVVIENNYLKEVLSDNRRDSYWVLSKNNKDITFFYNTFSSSNIEDKISAYQSNNKLYKNTIPYGDIAYNDKTGYNVFAPKYVRKFDTSECKSNTNVYKITDIVTVVPRVPELVKGDFIVSGLTDNYLSCDLKPKDVEMRTMEGYIVPNNSIIVYNGRFVKVKDLGVKIYAPKEYYCLSFKENDIAIEDYFLKALNSKFVKSQCQPYHPNNLDFEDLWICLPKIETQLETISEESKKWAKKMEADKQKSYEDYKLDIRMKKHSLGQTLADMNNWFNILLRNKKNGILNDNDMVGKTNPIPVSNVIEKIQNDIAMLFRKVEAFTLADNMTKEEFELVPFMEDFITKHESPYFKFQFETHFQKFSRDNCYIEFSKDALRTILENIISNAISHGFDNINENNIVKIEIIEKTYEAIEYELEGKTDKYKDSYDIPVKYYFTLVVSNNGKPLAQGLTQEKMERWGETTNSSHTGIGVFQIKELWEKIFKMPIEDELGYGDYWSVAHPETPLYPPHNEIDGKFEILSNPDDEFTVSYNFTFGGETDRALFYCLTGKTDLL